MSGEKGVAPEIRARVLHGTNLLKLFCAHTLFHPTQLNYCATLMPEVLNMLWKRAVGWGCGLARPHTIIMVRTTECMISTINIVVNINKY